MINNNYSKLFTEVEVASGGFTSTEVNNWDNWAQKWWFLTHLLLPTISILARKWPNGRRVFLPTNKTFEGICLAYVGKFLQKELWILFLFETIL